MAPPMSLAMRALEGGRFDEAAERFAKIAGSWRDGTNGAPADAVIARFRRAEALSRLGRHDEAAADAREAHAGAPSNPATALWRASVLAEGGQFAEAAAVAHPCGHEEFTDCVRDGFAALAKLAAGSAGAAQSGADRDEIVQTILASRHAPLFSLAIRAAESDRLRREPRWPDPLSVWFAHVARTELAEMSSESPWPWPLSAWLSRGGRTEAQDAPVPAALIPPAPPVADPSLPSRSEVRAAAAWLRDFGGCGYEPRLVAALRNAKSPPADTDTLETEMLLAAGRIDEAAAVVTRVRAETKDSEAGAELCITACRVEHLLGRPARPAEFPGFDDAQSRAKTDLSWLEMCAALLDGRPLDARSSADALADPSHAEYVEASLLRWAGAAKAGAGDSLAAG